MNDATRWKEIAKTTLHFLRSFFTYLLFVCLFVCLPACLSVSSAFWRINMFMHAAKLFYGLGDWKRKTTILNAFTGSCLFNATAVAAQTNSDSFTRRRHQYVRFQFLAPTKLFRGLAPIWVWRWKLHFPSYRWKSVQPFPRTVVWYFVVNEKKNKKRKKNICIYTVLGLMHDDRPSYHLL